MRVQVLGGSRAGAPSPARPSRRPYYGWVLAVALGCTSMVSYGVLSYAFPVFLAPMEAELGWSRTALTGAFSLAALAAGLVALPVGRRVDRHGARGVMTVGSVAAALLLVGWARVETLAGFYLLWIGLGAASAAVHYEPAFAVMASWFRRRRDRALTVLTFLGGLASIVFVPLTTALVEERGWREALLWLAAAMLVLTAVPHGLLLRRHPADLGLSPDGGRDTAASPADPPLDPSSTCAIVASRPFVLLALSFSLVTAASTALAVHLIPLLMERGFDAGYAAAALAAVGLVALPGRLILTPLGGRLPRPAVTGVVFGMLALGTLALLVRRDHTGVWAFVVLFGGGFGAVTPARAAMVAELWGPARYGRVGGALALVLSVARAVAPVGASLLHQVGGGYGVVLATLASLSVLGGATVVLLGKAPPLTAPSTPSAP